MDKYKPERVANSVASELIRKIQDKRAKIGVIGLGYVGLPLAVDKAIAGYEVIGFDIVPLSPEKVCSPSNASNQWRTSREHFRLIL